MTDAEFDTVIAGLFGPPCPIAAAELAASEAERIEAFNAPVAKRQLGSPCSRCSGKGRLTSFTHIQGGLCFACNGSGLGARR